MKTHTKLEHITVFRIENEISLDKIIEYHNTLKNSLDNATQKRINILTICLLFTIGLCFYSIIRAISVMQLYQPQQSSVLLQIIILIGFVVVLLRARKRTISNYHKRPIREELLKRCTKRERILQRSIIEDLLDDPSEITLNFLREKRILK